MPDPVLAEDPRGAPGAGHGAARFDVQRVPGAQAFERPDSPREALGQLTHGRFPAREIGQIAADARRAGVEHAR